MPDVMKILSAASSNEYANMARYIDEHPDTLVMDFENILAGTEKHGHEYLLEAARHGGFSSVQHKGFVTCLVIIHAMRSPTSLWLQWWSRRPPLEWRSGNSSGC